MAPDLMVFAKGVNSGYVPLGGVLVGDAIYETFTKRPYPAGLTYSGHPLACAAAVGAIGAMHAEGTIVGAARLGTDILGPGLAELREKHPSVGDVRGIGGLWTVELVRDRLTKDPLVPVGATGEANAPMAAFGKACLDRNLVPLISGNRIHVAPPLNLSDAEAASGLPILDEALTAVDPFLAWTQRTHLRRPRSSPAESESVRALLVCGVIAGPLFIVAFLIEGAVTPDYDPLRHPVSSLALGPFGWTQTAIFILAGLLTLAFAFGLMRLPGVRQKVGAILVGIWGVGLLGAGAFVTDPISGYPPGAPTVPVEATTSGALHDPFSVAAFFSLAAACFVLAGGAGWRWAVYSVLSGAAFLGAFFVAGLGFAQIEPYVDVAGLWQRVCVIIGWTWLTLLALRLLRRLVRI